MRNITDGLIAVLLSLLFIGALVFGVWFHFAAPCSWHQFETYRHMPARCWSYFNHR